MFLARTKRIPTILALIILLFGIGGGIFFAETTLKFKSQAGESQVPNELRVTNKTHSMATISWVTNNKAVGVVYYNLEGRSLNKIAVDDRSQFGGVQKFKTHHVTLRNLSANTKYEFIIQNGNKKYKNNGKAYFFKTYDESKQGKLEPAYGQVLFANDQPAEGAIVYLTLEGAEPLSTLVKSSGNWLIPLNIARSSLSSLPINETKEHIIELFIQSPTGESAQAITDTNHDSPVALIVIGKRYNFRLKAKTQAKDIGVLGKSTDFSVVILQPKDQQKLSSNRPIIRGKGLPGKKLSIVLESKAQSIDLFVNSDGNWTWTPPNKLTPGLHKVTVTTVDKNGKPITLNRSFIILKSGSRVLGEATPSATLAPSPTSITTPTPTTVFDTPVPTATEGANLQPGDFTYTMIFLIIGSFLVLVGLKPVFMRS